MTSARAGNPAVSHFCLWNKTLHERFANEGSEHRGLGALYLRAADRLGAHSPATRCPLARIHPFASRRSLHPHRWGSAPPNGDSGSGDPRAHKRLGPNPPEKHFPSSHDSVPMTELGITQAFASFRWALRGRRPMKGVRLGITQAFTFLWALGGRRPMKGVRSVFAYS